MNWKPGLVLSNIFKKEGILVVDEGKDKIQKIEMDPKKENWYLPYMDQKTKGIEIEERQSPVAIFYCAGASNVGQVTMLASVDAANKAGYDKAALLCLASISAGLKNIHGAAREAKAIITVDGCPMQCARHTMEKAEFNVDKSFVVTRDFEVKKNFNLNSQQDLEKISTGIVNEVLRMHSL
jgi:uncharacterized metal-binding protein